ncbi:hypothetical protein [Streptomyces hygroscopicus]|uniref:hypothetical protein n=1 Tax=Streptomyces hygroscopicus TaxID=1912 RepID=UPI00068C64C5|nr:hypothetical protein [Streptomyces hygroscopicus]
MADRVEAEQIATAEAVLSLAQGMLDTGLRIEPDECGYLLKRLTECLRDVREAAAHADVVSADAFAGTPYEGSPEGWWTTYGGAKDVVSGL